MVRFPATAGTLFKLEAREGSTSRPARDYSLVGPNAKLAVDQGLVAADWYHTDVPRARMKQLMKRTDGPAIRDSVIWLILLAATGFGGYEFWGSWRCVPFFLCYGVLYGSASEARWHEAGHGTAFRTSFLNDALYQLASFMTLREPIFWRWSHTRHHTDTIIVGRDREIVPMRPPDILRLALAPFAINGAIATLVSFIRHSLGRITAEEADFIPEMEWKKLYWQARLWLFIYVALIATVSYFGGWLGLMYVVLPSLYGRWLVVYLGLTQHAGLAENVLDHRLNARTVYMNPFFRFIYWNMNYHVEHHMFPMVPYHALRDLHREVSSDMPPACKSTVGAYREILPALLHQLRDPDYSLPRELPPSARPFRPELHGMASNG